MDLCSIIVIVGTFAIGTIFVIRGVDLKNFGLGFFAGSAGFILSVCGLMYQVEAPWPIATSLGLYVALLALSYMIS